MIASHTYDIRNWELEQATHARIVMRPGAKVLRQRLMILAYFLVGVVPLFGLYQVAPGIAHAWALREDVAIDLYLLEEEKTQADGVSDIATSREAREETVQQRTMQIAAGLRRALLLLMIVLATAGMLAPMSCLWNKLRLEKTVRGDLSVFHQGIVFPSNREWPMSAFRRSVPVVREVTRNTRHGRYTAWCFYVNMTPVGPGDGRVAFHLVEQMEPPSFYVPPVVRQFAEALETLTGLPAVGFDEGAPIESATSTRSHTVTGAPAVSRRAYTSLDDVPPELRARFEQLQSQAERSGSTFAVSESITITENGETRTYDSVEAMPYELRTRYEQIKDAIQRGETPPGVRVTTDDIVIETSKDLLG